MGQRQGESVRVEADDRAAVVLLARASRFPPLALLAHNCKRAADDWADSQRTVRGHGRGARNEGCTAERVDSITPPYANERAMAPVPLGAHIPPDEKRPGERLLVEDSR